MATSFTTSSLKNMAWGDDAECTFTESAVDGSGIRLPGHCTIIQVTSSTVVNAATITPQFSIDGGATFNTVDVDREGRSYPTTHAGSAALKLPQTFFLPGGCVFRLYSSASQTSKTWTARAGK
jgi:hypothetical protein